MFARAYGASDAALEDDCSPETTFCIGSITKQFTTAAILSVVASGRLDLDEEIARFFRSQALPRRGISLRHLLSHTSGLSAKAEKAFCLGREFVRAEDVLNSPNDAEPGVSWRYCNTGFAIAARVLEEATGQKYKTLLQEVFEAAELRRTTVGVHEVGTIARGHTPAPNGFGYVSPVMPLAAFGSGDVHSTATDLVRWFRALSAGRVVSSELYRLMTTPFVLKSGEATSYGLGMFVSQFGGYRELSQDGNNGGFSSQLASYPDEDMFLAVLTNSSAHDAESLEKSITRSLFAIPEQIVLDLEVSTSELIAYSGDYAVGAEPVRVWAESGALLISKPSGRVERLLNQGLGVFAEGDAPDVRIRFDPCTATVSRNGKTLAILQRRFVGNRSNPGCA